MQPYGGESWSESVCERERLSFPQIEDKEPEIERRENRRLFSEASWEH